MEMKKDNEIVSYKNSIRNCISNVILLLFHLIDLSWRKYRNGYDSVLKC